MRVCVHVCVSASHGSLLVLGLVLISLRDAQAKVPFCFQFSKSLHKIPESWPPPGSRSLSMDLLDIAGVMAIFSFCFVSMVFLLLWNVISLYNLSCRPEVVR